MQPNMMRLFMSFLLPQLSPGPRLYSNPWQVPAVETGCFPASGGLEVYSFLKTKIIHTRLGTL